MCFVPNGGGVVRALVLSAALLACAMPLVAAEDPLPYGPPVLAAGPRCRAVAEIKILRALDSPTTFDFDDTPLAEVVDYLKDFHKIEIQIHERALEDVGIGSDTPITRHLKGITLRSALRLMLKELDLTYIIRDEVLLITTPEEAEESSYTSVYEVGDLVTEDETVEELATVVGIALDEDADTQIATFRTLLVVRSVQSEHFRIEETLRRFRAALKLKSGWAPREKVHPLTGLADRQRLDLRCGMNLDDDLIHIKSAKGLLALNLSGCVTDKGLVYLADLTNLKRLNLSKSRMLGRGLKHLANLKNLTHLNLADTSVSDEDLRHLAGMAKLEHLDLSGTQVTGTGLAYLNKEAPIRTLSLKWAPVTETKHLEKMTALRNLDLSYATIDKQTVAELRRTLSNCSITLAPEPVAKAIRGPGNKPGVDPFGDAGGAPAPAGDEDPFGNGAPAPAGGDPFGDDPGDDPFGDGELEKPANPVGAIARALIRAVQ